MPAGLYRRKEIWYARVYVNGRCVRASTETADKRQAQRKREEIKSRLLAESGSTVTWKGACVRWLNAQQRSDNDRYILRALNYPDRPLLACTPESFEEALSHLSKPTFNRYRAIIVAVCNLSGYKLDLKANRTKNARLRILSREEWHRLYSEIPAHLKPLALFSILTGLRQHNVTHLRWDAVDLQRGYLWVHSEEVKSRKNLGIPLSPEAVAVLKGQIGKDKQWVFPYQGRGRKKDKVGPMTKIKSAWQLAMERAGLGHFIRTTDAAGKLHKKWVGDFTWHGLRHTWASWHLMAGTPIEVLAKLGGWDDLRMVQRHYGHLAHDHLAQYAGNAIPWSPAVKDAA